MQARHDRPSMLLRSSSCLLATLALGAALAACAGDPGPRPPLGGGVPEVEVPKEVKLLPEPTNAPEDLPGVNTSELNERERGVYWRLVSQLYAPCPEVAVSIAECVKEQRECASCVPAAQLLSDMAHAGASPTVAIAAFNARFGAGAKTVDLADSPARGPADAPVTIIVWSDFECPACGHAVPVIDEILEKHPKDVRLVHKLYPLKSHTHSRPAARASIAARKQGKYWEMEKMLFSHQKALEDSDLKEYAKSVGLDMKRFEKDFADPKADEIIDRDRAEADKQGLTGTPFILVNGREFDLGFFRVDTDLEPWIVSEVAIARKAAEKKAIGAVGATLSGEGKGPVAPVNKGVPAAPASTGTPAAPANSGAPAAPVATSAPSASAKP